MLNSKKVVLLRPIPQSEIERLSYIFPKFVYNREDRDLRRDELLQIVAGADAVISILTDKIDGEVIRKAGPQLKIIANYAAGIDNIDISAATQGGVFVTNTPGVNSQATADLTWGLMLATVRRIAEADQFSRDNKFTGWEPLLMLGGDLVGKTLGIIGAGAIGTAVAQRSQGWKMSLLYFSRRANPGIDGLGGRKVELTELLTTADIISLHAPLTSETRELINKKTLAMMKPTAYLINTSRGGLVDEDALVERLKAKKLAGAGLDVFAREPEIHEALKKLSNVVLAPHIGSATFETRTRMAKMAVDNVLAALKGNKPPNLVNQEVWK